MPNKTSARNATKPTARKLTAKGATKKPAAKKAAGGADVTVRMFCQGLGDCFLITIPQDGARPYSILIDFGVALGTAGSKDLMKQAADAIAKLTGGIIDLAVLTHEHWDHVSGYSLIANELLDMKKTKTLTFKHLWVAWTEKKDDPLAQSLRKEFVKATIALTAAIDALGDDDTSPRRLRGLNGVLAFYGLGAAKESSGSVADAMKLPHDLVDEETRAGAVDYLKPGECLTLPGATGEASGTQAFVLGPPYDRTKLRQLNPSTKGDDGYEKKKGEAPGVAFNWPWMVSALSDGPGFADLDDDDTTIDVEASFPFDKNVRISIDVATKDPRFASYYSAEEKDVVRRIDNDWLWAGAQRLGLWMDNYTNNTCLVLAFELPTSKQVLLFPADAQAGSWRSWHDQTYETKDGRTLTCTDLLAKTALYKVGHHGSHNATLRKLGLELMTHPDLVAMLPVEADGVTRLGYGQMPLKSLMKALNERTEKRVLRIDDTWTDDKAPGTWKKQGLSASLSPERITVGKKGQTSQRALYMQLSMRDG